MLLFELVEIFNISFSKYETRYIRIKIVICFVSFIFGEVFFFQLILLLALPFSDAILHFLIYNFINKNSIDFELISLV